MVVYNAFSYLKNFVKYNNPIRLFKNFYNKKVFLNLPPEKTKIIGGTYDIDIYIIAFNKPNLIEAQIKFLNKNLKDNYRLIIADNSNKSSEEIEKICEENDVSYIKLPPNKLEQSHSHGTALNYIMKHFIMKEKTKYFGLLDHDCFLLKPLSIVDKLEKQPFWGAMIDNIPVNLFGHKFNFAGNRWFSWPGCGFYRKDLFKKGYNFLPVKRWLPISFLDTGGGNRKYIYKFYKKENLDLFSRSPYVGDLFNGGEILGLYFYHMGGAGNGNVSLVNKKLDKLYENSDYMF